jgi:hypothetical protein
MAILNNSNAISSGGYDINNSLRFRQSASAYLSRTATTPTNNLKWTWSGWVKRGALNTLQGILDGYSNSSNWTTLFFNSDNTLYFYNVVSGIDYDFYTTALFRDPSAWYHIVFVYDSANATAANRVIIYVNGVSQSGSSPSGQTPQNQTTYINAATGQYLGRRTDNGHYFDGYLAEVNFIDGQALTPSSFGETSTTTGSWVPKAYTGTYGTNGFELNFSDIALTSGSNAGLGKDFSGNANYWNTNNISVTAGSTYDAMIDSPTLTSATVGNYCVLNPLNMTSTSTLSSANLNAAISGNTSYNNQVRGTIGMPPGTGKYYFEFTNNGGALPAGVTFGVVDAQAGLVDVGASTTAQAVLYYGTGDKSINGVFSAYGASYTTSNIIGCAVDMGAGTITFYKNNVSQGALSLPSTSVTYVPVFYHSSGSSNSAAIFNAGQRPFSYTPPTGFVRLNTFNLPDSTIVKGNLYMDSTLWTGNGTSQTIVNAGAFRPDFVWIKCRTVTEQHQAMDSVRGASKVLNPNQTVAETTDTTKLTAFNSNGFSVGSELAVNTNGATYVGWQWQAGQGSTSSNTSGTIASTVSVNTTAGFSIATYTGNGTGGATVGHGLGVAPKFIIVKTRSNIDNWPVGTAALGWDRHTLLNLTSATAVTSSTWNDTAPTPTVFSIGTDSRVNNSGWTYVAYCWAEIAGFSKFGSYTGNGSADGPFVYTGFRPEWLLVKQSSSAGNNWQLLDTARNTFNKADKVLFPSSSAVEGTGNATFDFLSNGVKIRAADGTINTSSSTYIYMAFAENPFKNANAR